MFDESHILSERQGQNLYLIADGAQIPGLAAELHRTLPMPQYRSLYQGTYLEPLQDIAPLLCDLSDSGHVLQWLSGNHKSVPWGIIIRSPRDFDETWQHLQSICWVRNSHGEIVLLRYYDPRVAEPLLQTEAESTGILLGPISGAWIPTPANGYRQLRLINGNMLRAFTQSQDQRETGWFNLQDAHEQAITDAHQRYLEKMISVHVMDHFPDCWDSIPHNERPHWVRQRIDQAYALGLDSPQDMLLLTNIFCLLGENCLDDSNHPAIQLLKGNTPTTPSERLSQAATLLERET